MAKENSDFHYKAAYDIIASARKNPLSMEVRKHRSVDLATHILSIAQKNIKRKERKRYAELARMMQDPHGKAFLTSMTDQCFRSSNPSRIADQLHYLIQLFGIPAFLSPLKRLGLYLFQITGPKLAPKLVPLAMRFMRKEVKSVIIPGEPKALKKHIQHRISQGVRLNINHLGEAILSEQEAERRLNIYLKDLKNENIEYVSIKISTIYSQINLISWNQTLEKLAERLRELYRAAINNIYESKKGERRFKFVNLDMEEYRDLHLTKELFMKVLNEEEFFHFSAGIVLQSYLPDAIHMQKELTEWAMQRVEKGGAPIKIRIVKGANLAMEHVEASLENWFAAPYKHKHETDANYKKMLIYGMQKQHAKAVHLGIASHNLFDISFAILLRAEQEVERYVSFEMLEGMADHMQRVVHQLTGSMLLYCAVATKEDFQSAIAYLLRRLDENTGRENFLRHLFGLRIGSKEWDDQVTLFSEACDEIETVDTMPRRLQTRTKETFENEPNTDFSLAENRVWARKILSEWKKKNIPNIPVVIAGKEVHQTNPEGQGFDPSNQKAPLYQFSYASKSQIDEALSAAKGMQISVEQINHTANLIRERRKDLIGAMIADGGKTLMEADVEVSEAIDFCEYYLDCMHRLDRTEDLKISPKGITLVAPPWNFPVSIPCGCISAALIAGNPVLFKPSSLTILAAYELAKIFWEAGVPKDLLQFIPCKSSSVGVELLQDPRLSTVALTGSSETARTFLKLRPDINLIAETGGKNPLIITDLCDRDLAVKDLLQSAFGHNGQKCSACSLAILEKEVYDDPKFRRQLKEAAESLTVDSNWNPTAKITPLIRKPEEKLLRGLTTLDQGEEWLVEPKEHPKIPNLWSPGIKLGVAKGSFMHQTELFGPVLGVMRAENLDHAIQLANATPYGLTSGLHTLDDREKKKWQQLIIAGNCYINRGITGAIVRRQPFGGTKASSFGQGFKAGGPNYITQFLNIEQIGIPKEKFPVNNWVNTLSGILDKFDLSGDQLTTWYTSVSNYAFWWKRYQNGQDPSKVVGEDNFLLFVPHKKMCVRIYEKDSPIDYLRIFAAALTCSTPLQVSFDQTPDFPPSANWGPLLPICSIIVEDEETFLKRLKAGDIKRIRILSKPGKKLLKIAAEKACFVNHAPVLANGRIELFHYLREMAISHSYHRYGNLGLREDELRRPIY